MVDLMKEPLVSIIIPTYNRAETIKETILSVLNQSYDCIEVLVIDDASDDETETIVKGIKDTRVFYKKNKKNIGANKSRNKGIACARGEYIAFIDSADQWAFDKIEKQLCFMQNNFEKLNIVFCSEHINTPKGDFVIPTDEEKKLVQQGKLGEIFSKGKNCVDTSSIFCKKECFNIVGNFDGALPRGQEYEWLLRAVQKCNIGFLDECLVEANIREDSISSDIHKLLHAIPQIYNKHHDFFVKYGRPIDILMSPVRELCRTGQTFSFFEKYFELMNYYIDVRWESVIETVYIETLKLVFGEKVRNQYRIQNIKSGYTLENLLKGNKRFSIFGAGKIAKDFYMYLKRKGLNSLVERVIVTSIENNQQLDDNISLLAAKECDGRVKRMPLLLAIDNFIILDVIELLEGLQFENIVIMSQDEWS